MVDIDNTRSVSKKIKSTLSKENPIVPNNNNTSEEENVLNTLVPEISGATTNTSNTENVTATAPKEIMMQANDQRDTSNLTGDTEDVVRLKRCS
ncbi:hypothetical protein KEM48_012867 [Puccinia striiformis f. sp. tritici PST-130]|nr:hypothetical protein Pst134EB_021600 [Puccinia striiformis f. sp. tritici]KAI9629520.1 hypothetical protein KEM48_012867 [Puccinia striiformis f. sp. tritici PST-130]